MTKQEFLNTVVAANESSMEIFKALVEQIDVVEINKPTRVSDNDLDDIVSDIIDQIVDEGTDILDDHTLSMDYNNQVILDDISVNTDTLQRLIKDVLTNYFERYDEE